MPEDRNNRDKFLDDVLDASLREYGRTDPRPGLEHRVLRAVEEQQQKRARGWFANWQWAAAAACTVIIAGGAALLNVQHVAPGDLARPGAVQNKVGTGAPARPGAAEQRSVTPEAPAVVVPPANHTPRYNRVRDGAKSGVRSSPPLPDCKPDKKSKPESATQESAQERAENAQDCPPAASERKPLHRPVPRD